MASIHTDKYNVYSYIGVSDAEYQHNSLILDSNVVINLEKLFYKPNKLHNKLEATRDLLLENTEKNLFYGFGRQESCWDYMLEGINEGQIDKLDGALEQIFNWDKEQILSHSVSTGINYEGQVSREKANNISTLVPQIKECNPLILGSYACVLKIMSIQKEELSRVESARKFVDFSIEELKTIHAFETQLTLNYFLGNDELYAIGNGIFKFDRQKEEILLKAWNATWDIFFLRTLQRAYIDYSFLKIDKPKLVTADQSLVRLARLCSLEGAIQNNNNFVSILSFDGSLIKKEFEEIVEGIDITIQESASERTNAREKIEDKESFLIEQIKRLEIELLNS
ncbi:hypothetical protein P4U05_11190 [Bacillus paranthracis]|uniref:hypothetical protein n=1 Tax=Bacillus paranthracis TaxID=2026186 RepID=UPI000200EDDB|nr:hypothetical protein [Bacillus paranthracis]ADY19677.1 hypothetical protein YBT020_02135 [Bacillus thuringiensis serovar finitimus YBT-020]MRC71241.1 hypothetical protein [Bacillus thuringiensis]OTX74388.1 hypothetical protein BK722_06945 [Bacillus thuringiensis serovar finitimus]MCR6800020.1 hypothetical protein [Bacillus paranthracis]MEC3359206.1 hypothetical protein [Bacillus paranthracis]